MRICARCASGNLEQGEEGMRRGARDDFEKAGVLQFAKCPNDVALEGFGKKARAAVKNSR